MPEISTQTELRDTHRSVYTQCGGTSKIAVTVIRELSQLKEISVKARRNINSRKILGGSCNPRAVRRPYRTATKLATMQVERAE